MFDMPIAASEQPLYACENFQDILPNFIEKHEEAFSYEEISRIYDENKKITITTYMLFSQEWPKEGEIWKHKMVVYQPDTLLFDTAFLYVNGGYSVSHTDSPAFTDPKNPLDFAKIALRNNAFIADLQDVPNQFLVFDDNIARKEDDIISYSYKKVMENPEENAYWAGHLPMAKAITQAMNAVMAISREEGLPVKDFMVSGASKRGWAVWLAALVDERITAIMPIVIDVLNVSDNIKNICSYYNNTCPEALKPYKELFHRLDSEEAKKLLCIEDPFAYMHTQKFKERMEIPKYIINASGDDFFVPNSSHHYFKALPGDKNTIRYVPNESHYMKSDVVTEAALNLFHAFLHKTDLPSIKWTFAPHRISVTSSIKPDHVTLYVAENDEMKDFRYNHYSFWLLDMFLSKKGDIRYIPYPVEYNCSQKEPTCHFVTSVPLPKKDFQAAFVEMKYNLKGKEFIFTSEIKMDSKEKKPF